MDHLIKVVTKANWLKSSNGIYERHKLMPQCGFSNNVVQILNSLGIEFNTDVLSDFEIREGIKEYSDWPTIPQVYLKGEFLGGSDILIGCIIPDP